MAKEKALLLLSGGQDSTTAAIWAQREGYDIEAIVFNYGQRHKIELKSAAAVAKHLGIPYFVKVVKDILPKTSALTNSKVKLRMNKKNNLPTSFVPGRNLLFLTIAAAEAYIRDIHVLITGVSEEDYSGYPDCREAPIQYLADALSHGLDFKIQIKTPWMHVDKAAEIEYLYARDEQGILALTHTCYNGVKGGCGKCPACKIRAAAFEKAGYKDPMVVLHRKKG